MFCGFLAYRLGHPPLVLDFFDQGLILFNRALLFLLQRLELRCGLAPLLEDGLEIAADFFPLRNRLLMLACRLLILVAQLVQRVGQVVAFRFNLLDQFGLSLMLLDGGIQSLFQLRLEEPRRLNLMRLQLLLLLQLRAALPRSFRARAALAATAAPARPEFAAQTRALRRSVAIAHSDRTCPLAPFPAPATSAASARPDRPALAAQTRAPQHSAAVALPGRTRPRAAFPAPATSAASVFQIGLRLPRRRELFAVQPQLLFQVDAPRAPFPALAKSAAIALPDQPALAARIPAPLRSVAVALPDRPALAAQLPAPLRSVAVALPGRTCPRARFQLLQRQLQAFFQISLRLPRGFQLF